MGKYDKVKDMDLLIQVLPNEYNLSLSNVSIKHVVRDIDDIYPEYVTLKCKVNYSLNGKKPGKRKIVFVSYDSKGRVLEIRGNHTDYKFTELGFEFVEECFNDAHLTGISVYIKD